MKKRSPTPPSLVEQLKKLRDPRVARTRAHPLINILTMGLCGAICGTEGWDELVDFCRVRREWFAGFLDMSAGVPSADTFRRVYERLDPQQFQKCLVDWVKSLSESLDGEVVAIDGKTLRGVVEKVGKHNQLHMVHVWATKQKLLLAQKAVGNGAAGEMAAIPELLDLLDVRGAIVTTDANGSTAPVTRAIVEREADYVLAVKSSRGRFYHHLVSAFEGSEPKAKHREEDEGHGRRETREVTVRELDEWPWETKNNGEWAGLRTAVKIERHRETMGETSVETQYYVSSLAPQPRKIATAIRAHWGIENGLHWLLDVAFDDDRRGIRDRVSAENWATLSRIALMLVKNESSRQRGVKAKRKIAGWDPDYLARILISGKSIT
jgi:predicted transposase YbfD/YdcC